MVFVGTRLESLNIFYVITSLKFSEFKSAYYATKRLNQFNEPHSRAPCLHRRHVHRILQLSTDINMEYPLWLLLELIWIDCNCSIGCLLNTNNEQRYMIRV